MLRTLIIAMALLVLPMVAGAQAIAVYDGQAVFNAMTEKADAEAQLQRMSQRLNDEYRQMQDDFNRKYVDYQTLAADPDTPASIKERRMREIQESDKKIRDFQLQAQEELKVERDRLTVPLRAAIAAAVAEVADEAGYAVVLDRSAEAVTYIGSATPDITAKVKAKLGL